MAEAPFAGVSALRHVDATPELVCRSATAHLHPATCEAGCVVVHDEGTAGGKVLLTEPALKRAAAAAALEVATGLAADARQRLQCGGDGSDRRLTAA